MIPLFARKKKSTVEYAVINLLDSLDTAILFVFYSCWVKWFVGLDCLTFIMTKLEKL